MTTHPLSPAAVEAGAKAAYEAEFPWLQNNNWEKMYIEADKIDPRLKYRRQAETALSAAFEQARAEGNVIDAFGSAPEDGGYSAATWATALEPVLIIRKPTP